MFSFISEIAWILYSEQNTTVMFNCVIKSPFPKYKDKSQVHACFSSGPEDLGHILILQSDKPRV